MKPDINFDKPTLKGRHVQTTTAFESLPNQKSAIVSVQDFDYDAIDCDEPENDAEERNREMLAQAFSKIVQWIYRPGVRWLRPQGCKARLYAFLWIAQPQLFSHPTEKQMAKRFGISVDMFCDAVCSFRDTFHFTLPSRVNDAQGATLKTKEHRNKMSRAAMRRKAK